MDEDLEEFEVFLWLDSCFDVIVGNIVRMWGMLKNNNNIFGQGEREIWVGMGRTIRVGHTEF